MNKQIPPEETKGQLDAIIDNYSPKGVSPKGFYHWNVWLTEGR